jgi:site-specific DNA-cytosine methylase
MQGVEDPRAEVWWRCVEWIIHWARNGMKAYSMEMVVKALESQNGFEPVCDLIRRTLEENLPDWMHYNWILNLTNFGIPHDRTRLWVSGTAPEFNKYDKYGVYGVGGDDSPPQPVGVELGFPQFPPPLYKFLGKFPASLPSTPTQLRHLV